MASTILRLIVFFSLTCSHGVIASQANSFNVTNIDERLQQSESNFTDLVSGTEKHIRWIQESREQREYSIVYIHGFSASGKEVSPMIEQLADRLNANLYYSRLQGHGRTNLDAMGEATLQNWKKEALSALKIGALIGKKTILIGTSTGGTLITWLNVQEQAKDVHSTVMISPNFGVKNRLAGLMQWSWLRWIIKKTQGEYRSFKPFNDYHATYWTTRYPVDALLPMLDLVDEVDELDKSAITTPQLIIYSPQDQIVDVEETAKAVKSMVNTKVTTTHYTETADPVQHLLVGMVSTPEQITSFVELIYDHLAELANTKPQHP